MEVMMKRIVDSLLDLIYPRVCEVCGRSLLRGEEVMCLHCAFDLPRTNVHNDPFNTIHRRLATVSVPVERAAGYFLYYREGGYNDIIHRAKYQGRPSLMRAMGERFARELESDGFFDDIDIILPVPIHWMKMIRRGYNQSAYLADGISNVTGIPVGDNLRAVRGHSTQTSRSDFSRWLNARSVYCVRDSAKLAGRHILVVDDVITTGATMIACCNAIISAVPTVRLSVLSLGVAHMS